MSRTILVLGATSAVATAYCRRLAGEAASFILVARNPERLESIAADLQARGASKTVTVASDLADMFGCEDRFHDFCSRIGAPDQVVLAYGVLGDQSRAEADADETRRVIDVNFTSAALWLQIAAKHLPNDKPRWIIVIGSVAGDRGRRSNYVYGSAKAGLDAFSEGLAHRLHGTALRVLTVKPGFVDTPMTAHLHPSGPLWASPDVVAADIERAVRKGRRVVYTPWFWRWIMVIIRLVPRGIFYRTPL
ncbi:MAG: decaprenylphospho-beta-D-erythro-pentofuranosid-2-ulose 2-reductase [Alphaproteobacteria bacterium]|nr:decaprenylphospho-beta-D-erythro-pentofuranosid-2-ulose 2-reductase [Alphaproteobacteria bacterium]